MAKTTKVFMVASELAPLAKTGGLGDVIDGLSIALANAGREVTVMIPCYQCVKNSGYDLSPMQIKLTETIGEFKIEAEVVKVNVPGDVRVVALDVPQLYDREELYIDPQTQQDYEDNDLRFGFLSKAALSFCRTSGYRPDIIHCNDWQTGLIPAYLYFAEDKFFSRTGSVFTIHNLSYMGLFPPEKLDVFALPEHAYSTKGVEYFEKISLLKAGIAYADAITTVSEKYAEEIKTPDLGYGMETLLTKRNERLFGIVNGVDYQRWSPNEDPLIAARYSTDSMEGKNACKKELIQEFGLSKRVEKKPLFGVISRLVEQKGLDLIVEIIPDIVAHGGAVVVLGQGDKKIEAELLAQAVQFEENVGVKIIFDERYAHQIEAGADFFLMPSRFEPCGLNQLYSLKYGTIPVVHAVGGLDDTIKEFYPKSGRGNGFKFSGPEPELLLKAVMKGMDLFTNPETFAVLRQNAMAEDYSWDKQVRKYVMLYNKARDWAKTRNTEPEIEAPSLMPE